MKFLHTMFRVSDLDKSIDFYTKALWMEVLNKKDNNDYKYTLVFLWYSENDTQIELTYNWWDNTYDIWNAYGHIALEVDDLYSFCDNLKKKNVNITREPGPVLWGTIEIAFIRDPDNYSIELIQKWSN